MRVKLMVGVKPCVYPPALSPEGVFCVCHMRTVEWNYEKNTVRMIEQRKLPAVFEVVEYDHYRQVAEAAVLHEVLGFERGLAGRHGLGIPRHHLAEPGLGRIEANGEHAAHRLAPGADSDQVLVPSAQVPTLRAAAAKIAEDEHASVILRQSAN